jgi:hypothetical protein
MPMPPSRRPRTEQVSQVDVTVVAGAVHMGRYACDDEAHVGLFSRYFFYGYDYYYHHHSTSDQTFLVVVFSPPPLGASLFFLPIALFGLVRVFVIIRATLSPSAFQRIHDYSSCLDRLHLNHFPVGAALLWLFLFFLVSAGRRHVITYFHVLTQINVDVRPTCIS